MSPDLHVVFNDDTNRLTVWDAAHTTAATCEARNAATAGPGFGHNGRCPRGEFTLGMPVAKGTVPFGPWFIPVVGEERFGRDGIGIHGGGSGLARWDAPRQGWAKTHGCIRVQNQDLETLVGLVKHALAAGGTVRFTVAGA